MLSGKFLGVAALVAAALGAPAEAEVPRDLRARADAIVAAAYPADGPGGAVIISRGGETLYTAGRGLADVETRRPITPDTVFRLGSITKQFTAAVVMQLVQEGRLSLDDPITRFFPDYPQPGGAATVRQLLQHTSGIQSYTAIPGFMAEANIARPYTTEQMIALFRDLPSPTPPGQEWAYNNSGYVMLGAIVERVTGMPWHQAVAERITRPLGLSTIGYGVDRESGAAAMARGYSGSDQVRPAMNIHMSVPHAAGALVGTVGDLARWADALHHGRVVDQASYAAMTTPAALPEGRTHPYGFGLGLDAVRGRPAVGHSGGIPGFTTDSVYVPSENIFVAVFANSNDPAVPPGVVARRLAALAVGEPYEEFTRAEVDPATLAPLFGVYRVSGEDGVERRFFARDGKLYTARQDGPDREVFAAGGDRFFYGPESLSWFRMERRPDGAHVMEMHQDSGETDRATRTGDVPAEAPPAQVSQSVLQSYVGRYETAGPAADVAMAADGTLTIQLAGQPALAMRATSATEFAVPGPNARVVFHSENGAVTRLVIHHGGRELEGRRVR